MTAPKLQLDPRNRTAMSVEPMPPRRPAYSEISE